ncbi:MAG: hypothetical protein RSB66_05605 [Clostridium sp.]
MSIEKIIYTGILSYIIIATNRTLEIAFKFNLYDTQSLGLTLVYLLSSVLTFISFYALCSYTDKSSVAGKLNLIAVFSIIPMLAFDCVNLLSYIIDNLNSLYTRGILFACASSFSCILFTLFLYGIKKYKTSSSNSKIFNGLLISTSLLLVVTLIDSTITIISGTYDPTSLIVYILKTVVFVFMVINYKHIVIELITIANNTVDSLDDDDEYFSI